MHSFEDHTKNLLSDILMYSLCNRYGSRDWPINKITCASRNVGQCNS